MRQLSKDLQEFIHLLNQEKVEYLIVGAWALAFHGRPRYTGDIDIFIRAESSNSDRMMRVIEAFGFGNTGLTREDFLRRDFVVQLGVEPNRIDLLTGISGVSFEEAWREPSQGSRRLTIGPRFNRSALTVARPTGVKPTINRVFSLQAK